MIANQTTRATWHTGLLCVYHSGVILEYERRDGTRNTKIIDLLALTPESDLDALADQVIREEPLVSEARKPQLCRLLNKLVEKQLDGTSSRDFCEDTRAPAACSC